MLLHLKESRNVERSHGHCCLCTAGTFPRERFGGGSEVGGALLCQVERKTKSCRVSWRNRSCFSNPFKSPLPGKPHSLSCACLIVWTPGHHISHHLSLPRQRARKHPCSKTPQISARTPTQKALRLSITFGYLR